MRSGGGRAMTAFQPGRVPSFCCTGTEGTRLLAILSGTWRPDVEKARLERQFGDELVSFNDCVVIQNKKIVHQVVKGDPQRSRKLRCRFGSQEAEARAGSAHAHAYDAHAYAQDGPMTCICPPCIRCRGYVRRCVHDRLPMAKGPTPE